jgi:hypothetical protein
MIGAAKANNYQQKCAKFPAPAFQVYFLKIFCRPKHKEHAHVIYHSFVKKGGGVVLFWRVRVFGPHIKVMAIAAKYHNIIE